MTYVILYSRDGGSSWRLWSTPSENRDDQLRAIAHWQRQQPHYQYAMKCLDTLLWNALQAQFR